MKVKPIFVLTLMAILSFALPSCEDKEKGGTMFTLMPASDTNVEFANMLSETDEFNIIEYLYFYNGAGVAAGDINNDGLIDLYFSGNQVTNKLYLNQGNLVFKDITTSAGAEGVGNWRTGVSMADVNGDGLLDIFTCGVGRYKQFNGWNQLLINNGDLTFSDKTGEYGLNFSGFSTHSAFFDYDNDGDLDMYLLNHAVHTIRSYGDVTLRFEHDSLSGDRLYRNELIPTGKTFFIDVTKSAGILSSQIGYGLGVGISDVNKDGFQDIYVSNDFHENDYLYLNTGKGTFNQVLEQAIPHCSRFTMGNVVADINNDTWPDILTLDMLPRNEPTIKSTAGEDSYEIYRFKLDYGFHYQYSRNMLQLNRGISDNGIPLFSDIAPLAGLEATDWSWSPLCADYDNDGNKDYFFSNGIAKRPNDLDYINFISNDSVQKYLSDFEFIDKMPSGSVPNVFFRNKGDLTFEDVSDHWIGEKSGLSQGAASTDLDNDGDLDIVVNNLNEKAFIYRNDLVKKPTGYVNVKLNGNTPNPFGLGAKILVYKAGQTFYHEQMFSKGYQSSSAEQLVHVGVGKGLVDSVMVIWSDQKYQVIHHVGVDTTIVFNQKDAKGIATKGSTQTRSKALLSEGKPLAYKHREDRFIPFNVERLLPHALSTQGPKIAVGDINNDNLDDFFIGGGAGQPGQFFLQTKHGDFQPLKSSALEIDSLAEDTGSLIFDANGDGRPDLLVVSGGQQKETPLLHKPRLYINGGNGKFERIQNAIPDIVLNASCVKHADIDNDGDFDLFIGGRVVAGKYGTDAPSYLLANDGTGIFSNVTEKYFENEKFGMVSDAVWTDLNLDKHIDLIVVGEWMPITVFMQRASTGFDNVTARYGLQHTNGWWNTIIAHDIDRDGDQDFLVGNYGINSRLRASQHEPLSLYVSDIDQNGSDDPILTYYNKGEVHPFISRDQLVRQVPMFRKKYLKYSKFKEIGLNDILPDEQLRHTVVKHAYMFESVYLEMQSDSLKLKVLPVEAQMFPIFSFCVADVNGDKMSDVLAVGNLFEVQPDVGRSDAGYGLILLGDARGNFQSKGIESGFTVKGEGRDIKAVAGPNQETSFLIGRNNDTLLRYKMVKGQ